MKGRDQFSDGQAQRIRELLDARSRAERPQQKRLRDELRDIGFFISDWGGPGLGRTDFDQLIERGMVTICGEPSDATGDYPTVSRAADSGRALSSPVPPEPSWEPATTGSGASVKPEVVNDARRSLADPGYSLADAPGHVPDAPGLYAIHGVIEVWRALDLGDAPDARPLYVGKAEDSLVSRDLRTHFGSGRTGSSTVRRSFAALLRIELDLHARPRNTTKPERPANYSLAADGDERLTSWMQRELTLAVWLKPTGVTLIDVERQLLALWKPPLNLKDVVTPWSRQLSAARRAMADDARAWARERGFMI